VWSAGNGPAMRAAVLGVCLGESPDKLRDYVRACTRLTHRDPRAEHGALLIALAAHRGAAHGPEGVRAADFLAAARATLPEADDRLQDFLTRIEAHLERGSSVVQFADDLGLRHGVSGYIYHTVPVVLYAWLRWPGNFRRTVEDVIALGGDADTTGAIAGALAGATVGASGIPTEWLEGIWEWPRTIAWLRTLAERLAVRESVQGPLPLFWPALMPRNALFFVLVLLHGFRRLLPPY
jgi:ADP-ribosyl-[dinitrogen reductase] hydrolase